MPCDLIHISSIASSNTANPCLHVYRGPAAESEKETKAVTNFIRRHKNSIKAYITFHSYSQVLLFPYGYTSKLPPNYDDLVCTTYIYIYVHICMCTFTPSLTLNLFFNSFEVCWNGFTLFGWLFWNKVLVCNSDWPWIQYVTQPQLTLTIYPASASQILEIHFCHHTKTSHFKYQKIRASEVYSVVKSLNILFDSYKHNKIFMWL